jgi:hypothetical protein
MNCLSEPELQMYMDGELQDSALEKTEEHINACAGCAAKYVKIKNDKNQIFNLLDELNRIDSPVEIPNFIPSIPGRKYFKTISFAAVAASLLIFIGLGTYLKRQNIQQERTENIAKATIELTRNADPNQMLHKKQMVVVITNSSGEVVHSFITE